MRILIVTNTTDTVWFYLRNRLPAEFLENIGHEVRFETELDTYMHPVFGRNVDMGPISWADVVVFNRHYDVEDDVLRSMIEYAKNQGKRIVYETDDLLEAPECSHPMYRSIRRHISQIRMLAGEADVCTTTGSDLKEKLLHYNHNVVTLPYCIDRKRWKRRRGQNDKVRVGWQGRGSHPEDLLLLLDVIRDLQREMDFEFIVFGLSPMKWDMYTATLRERHEKVSSEDPESAGWYSKIMLLDEKLKGVKWHHEPFVPFDDYNRRLSKINLDVGLCPLVDMSFSRSKSVLKFYEYAMVGTATLASDVPPYRGKVSYIAKNTYSKWKTQLSLLVGDEDLRRSVAEEQRKWVLTHRDIRSNIHLWETAYLGDARKAEERLYPNSLD
jgi:hypothetical protein